MFDKIKSFLSHKLTTHSLAIVLGYIAALLIQYNCNFTIAYNHQTPNLIRQFQVSASTVSVHPGPSIDLFGVDKGDK